jgi:hypothetical protein
MKKQAYNEDQLNAVFMLYYVLEKTIPDAIVKAIASLPIGLREGGAWIFWNAAWSSPEMKKALLELSKITSQATKKAKKT